MLRLLAFVCLSFLCIHPNAVAPPIQEEYERGTFSIYFMDEKVGYEEFTWRRDASGILLTVEGRITKPVRMSIDELSIRLDNSFIATAFRFRGSVGGVEQDVESELREGEVSTTIRASGQEQLQTVSIRRDAFLLPNPIFSPYMVISKKFHCSLTEPLVLSSYLIPQVEAEFTLGPKENQPCTLILEVGATQIELVSDESGQMLELSIPHQRLRIVRD